MSIVFCHSYPDAFYIVLLLVRSILRSSFYRLWATGIEFRHMECGSVDKPGPRNKGTRLIVFSESLDSGMNPIIQTRVSELSP